MTDSQRERGGLSLTLQVGLWKRTDAGRLTIRRGLFEMSRCSLRPGKRCVSMTRRNLRHCGADAIKRGEALAAFATKHGLTDEATAWQRQFERLAK